MTIVKALIVVFLVVCVLFFLLGLKSQKGSPKGLADNRLTECGSAPNCVCSEPDGQPERSVAPLAGTMDQAKAAIEALGGVITTDSNEYVSATFMTKLFKFVDDVELRAGTDGTVHIRSASRVGYSDRGVNRKRVEAIRAKMNSMSE